MKVANFFIIKAIGVNCRVSTTIASCW